MKLSFPSKLLTPLALFLIAFLAYFNSFNHAFLLDDWTLIVPSSFDPYFLQILGTHTTAVYYRPLLHVLCAMNHALFGDFVAGYHMVNFLLFYLTGLSFYILIQRLFNNSLLALLSALLFLSHPINGVLVNYKIAVGYVFMILAANLSLLAMLREPLRITDRLLSIAWFAAALLCHEVLAVFPLYLAAMLMIARKKSFREAATAVVPYIGIVLVYLYQRTAFTAASNGLIKTITGAGLSLGDVTAMWMQSAEWYFSQLIAPTQIVLVKEILSDPLQTSYDNILFVLAAVIFAGLWRYSSNNPPASLGLVWLAISFIPVTVASISRPEMGAIIQPHWVTFGSLGFFLWLASMFASIEKSMKKPVWVTMLTFILSGYILSSLVHNQNWRDQKTYCLYWLQSSPRNFWANFSLGQSYLAEGNYRLAKKYLERSIIDGKAGYPVWQNLGFAEYHLGNFEKAEMYFRGVLQTFPNDPISNDYLQKIQAGKISKQ